MSWTVIHDRQADPVAVADLVELAEGPWLHTGLLVSGPEDLSCLRAGLHVTAEFVHPPDGESYPLFRASADDASVSAEARRAAGRRHDRGRPAARPLRRTAPA